VRIGRRKLAASAAAGLVLVSAVFSWVLGGTTGLVVVLLGTLVAALAVLSHLVLTSERRFQYEPLRVFGPPAVLFGLAGVGKLVYDLVDKNFRVGTNTMLILGVALALLLIGMIADLLVQLNRERHDVIPAVADDGP
jgi:hypothetical protein